MPRKPKIIRKCFEGVEAAGLVLEEKLFPNIEVTSLSELWWPMAVTGLVVDSS